SHHARLYRHLLAMSPDPRAFQNFDDGIVDARVFNRTAFIGEFLVVGLVECDVEDLLGVRPDTQTS
ncbi:MAG TPA: hypothetical protein PLH75_08880, partial [Amaricoccus sp.]|nr:hypothetical protein [Amaricoccus sp.]